MGRITVFRADGCADSKLIQDIFEKHSIPYEVICLSKNPRRRTDMIQLTSRITTPQVFFNRKYMGGVLEISSLMIQYEKEAQFSGYPSVSERISMEVLKGRNSHNRMLSIPKSADSSTVSTLSIQEQNEHIMSSDVVRIINGKESTVGKITRDLINWLPRAKAGRLSRNKNSFSGSEAIECFIKHYHFPSSKSAISFGQNLLRLGILHRVTTDSIARDLFGKTGYFRLQPLQSPKILNSFRTWTKEGGLNKSSLPDISPLLTISWLLRQMTDIIVSVKSGGGRIDYRIAQNDSKFKKFEENVCQLQLINLEAMKDENSKKAFFINVYNLMMTHSFIKLCPKNANESFFSNVQYDIGGFIFSLEDIYHGILRNNSPYPKTCIKLFLESNPRATFSLRDKDARIHFAVNNGLGSCVAVHEYHMEAIDEELRVVAESYCASNERIFIDSYANRVVLPKFMSTFQSDFTRKGESRRLLRAVSKYLNIDRRNELISMQVRERKTGSHIAVIFGDEPGSLNSSANKGGIFRRSICGRRVRQKFLTQNWVELCSDSDNDSDDEIFKITPKQNYEPINTPVENEGDRNIIPFKCTFSDETLCKHSTHKSACCSSYTLENKQPSVEDLEYMTPSRSTQTNSDLQVTSCLKKFECAKASHSFSSIQTAPTVDESILEAHSSPTTELKVDEESILSTSNSAKRVDTEIKTSPRPVCINSGTMFIETEGSDQTIDDNDSFPSSAITVDVTKITDTKREHTSQHLLPNNHAPTTNKETTLQKFIIMNDALSVDKSADITDCESSFFSSSIISAEDLNNSVQLTSNDQFEALYNS